MDTNDNVSFGEDITPDGSISPVFLAPLTEVEEAEKAKLIQDTNKRLEEEQARKDVKESALLKLSKLGLTEEEARAIIGI